MSHFCFAPAVDSEALRFYLSKGTIRITEANVIVCSPGVMHPGDKPGLGVDIDETLATKYPYQRAYLQVNRKLDGTIYRLVTLAGSIFTESGQLTSHGDASMMGRGGCQQWG